MYACADVVIFGVISIFQNRTYMKIMNFKFIGCFNVQGKEDISGIFKSNSRRENKAPFFDWPETSQNTKSPVLVLIEKAFEPQSNSKFIVLQRVHIMDMQAIDQVVRSS